MTEYVHMNVHRYSPARIRPMRVRVCADRMYVALR